MDDITTIVQLRGLSEKQAMERIIKFAQRFGSLHTDLAVHAAFPLVLTPDLLYRIWATFLPQIPWTTVSDILLSPLCHEVGYELYEMDLVIRNILLKELREDNRFGESRLGELAQFLEDYIRLNLNSDDPDQRDLAEAQHWAALAQTAPDEAAREIASKILDPSQLAGSDLLRVATLTETLAPQLQEYSQLVHYTRGVERLANGDGQTASNLLNRVFEQKQDIEIAGVTLRRPRPAPQTSQERVEEIKGIESTETLSAPKIFISYRRADSGNLVGQMRQQLVEAFGTENVFKDWVDIAGGMDFRALIETELTSSNVMLVIIGPRWAGITDSQGSKRLFDPGDFTRTEIEMGLARPKMRVIPVLVMGADLPRPADLPESLQPLLHMNAISVRNDPHFDHDIKRLIQDIRQPQEPIQEGSERQFSREESSREQPGVESKDYEQAVFISYAWTGESEKIVNEMHRALQARGIRILRDKRDQAYRGSITGFMEHIGRSNCVIVVISDRYLRSPNCMFELVQIADLEQLRDRIFPVVLNDANIYDPLKRMEYVKYWDMKRAELAEAMKTLDPANLQGLREDMDLYDRIRDRIAGLASTLKDMNTLTPDMHRGSDFSDLYMAIEKRMKPSGGAIPAELEETLNIEYFEPETILIPEGPFLMGSLEGSDAPAYERPQHLVNLPAYRIGKYPVTNSQYDQFVREKQIAVAPMMGWDGQRVPPGLENRPVTGVTWYEALAFCQWLSEITGRSYSLPNEAQWEKACRGENGNLYPWGNDLEAERCNHGREAIAAVDAYPAQNELGVFDLVGNVRQWTCSLWGEKHSQPDTRYLYPWRDDERNSLSANREIRRVVRGSSMRDPTNMLRCSSRSGQSPDDPGLPGARHGFRVVIHLEERS
jgi:formylglycine-generating enzyme required for sulfatase activity